jgi:hypothetical protein
MTHSGAFPRTERVHLVALAVVCVAPLTLGPAQARAATGQPAMTLDAIIKNVAAAEALYDDIDVRFHFQMNAANADPDLIARYKTSARIPPKKGHIPSGRMLLDEWTCHYVGQGAWFRYERKGQSINDSDRLPRASRDLVNAFDGERQRILEQNLAANVLRNKQPERGAFRPHLVLLMRSRVFAPLSLILRGRDAIRASEFKGQIGPDITVATHYLGSEIYDGLPCQKVAVEFFSKTRRQCRFELWLAVTRNYIPARVICYGLYSATQPGGVGHVERWLKLQPGIWLPASSVSTIYDDQELLDHNIQKETETERYVVDKAQLKPHYPKQYFSDVAFPKGAPIYEIDNGLK